MLLLFSLTISNASLSLSLSLSNAIKAPKAMERQRSFIVKPTRLFLLFLTISSSLLFFFLFSFWVLNTTPSSAASNEAHLQFSTGFTAAIKAQAFAASAAAAAAAAATNFSSIDTKDSILGGAQIHLGPIASSGNFSANETKDPTLAETHSVQAADAPEEALGLGNERKDEILGDAQVRTSADSVLGSAMERKDAILMSSESSHSGSGTVEKIEEEVACDVSNGRWVFDESYPLYTSNSCPFIDEGFSCEANGRSDRDYMKWRWQPYQCSIPRFNPVKMLDLIRGKRLVFVGDSINRNQWESMLCMLRGAISDPSRVYEARGRRITKGRGNYNFKFVDYRCSVEYYLTHFLVHEGKARVNQRRRQTLRIDTIDKGSSRWKGADILVFNTAHWWSHYKTKSGLNYYQEGDQVHPHLDVNTAFRRAITTWASWVDRHIFPGKTQVFFRSSAPSHFSGGEWNAGGHCRESTRPLNDSHVASVPEMNLIVEEIVKQMRTPVTILNITTLSGFRIDGHPSVYGKKLTNGRPSSVQDCSHWCLPGVPDTWNELLYFNLLSGHRLISTN